MAQNNISEMETTTCTSPLRATYNSFKSFLGYESPLSFDEWSALADDSKAAALYVQFYDQITLAWFKTRSFYTTEEDGVSTCLQYLMKNVPVIKAKPERFSASYVYRVAYNCMYCICHDIKRDRERYQLESSNIVISETGDELDLFDTIPDTTDYTKEKSREEFWATIESMGEDTMSVVSKLLGRSDPSLPKVSESRKQEIIAELRIKLADYLDVFN